MTFEKLQEIIEKNNIPKDVYLMSDSGCEYMPTHMDGVFYDKNTNTITFTMNDEWSYPCGLNKQKFENLNPIYNYLSEKEDQK